MASWYRCLPILRPLPAQEAIKRAIKHLENTETAGHQNQALKECDKAKEVLMRINVLADIIYLDQITDAYCEHGRVLNEWGQDNEAILSYKKAEELREKYAATLAATASSNHPTPLSAAGNTITSKNLELIPASIFAKDYDLHALNGKLPKPDTRLDDTLQLAYCLGLLLQDPAELSDTLDADTRTWLQDTRENADEQERLKTLAKSVFLEFTPEKLKDVTAVAEIVCLAPFLEKQDFRLLLGQFVDSLSSSVLLNSRALEGLDQLVQGAPTDSIDADDLVKILEHLNLRLEETHSGSLDYVYRLTSVVSHILDAMVLGSVQGLNRVNLHTPLTVYLQKLLKSPDLYLAFQAAYASQALLWVSNDEELWKSVLRRAGTVTMGVARMMSATKALNVTEFIDGLGKIKEGLEGTGVFFRLVTGTYKAATELMKGRQDFQGLLDEGFSFSRKQKWYLLLRATDTLLRGGELIKFKSLARNAPIQCRHDVTFQWGVCQRLGYVAADSHWDFDTRQDAIAFLGEIYRNDAVWGQNVQVKQCILNILIQLAAESGISKKPAESLLYDLRNDGDATKQARYQAYIKKGLTPYPWRMVPPLLKSSPLLDRVQKKSPVEASLRAFQRQRLLDQEQRNALYIPLQAKASRERPDDELFDLTDKVNEFLTSDQKVLLIMGDSGAGKSTFNLELERNLWEAYNKYKGRIPVVITLPAIDKPDQDLIAKHLRAYDFQEEQIRELKSNRKFILICDGYDECQQKSNLYTSNRLNQPCGWNVQMIITCRSEYLGHDYRSRFQPGDRNDLTGQALLQEAVITPFSERQIRHYIERYIVKYSPRWKVEDYLQAFDRIPGLQGLVKNPFLLMLSLKVLSDMVDLVNDLSSTNVTRVSLYDKFVEQWVSRGMVRLHDKKLTGNDAMAFEELCSDGFTRNAICFVKDLAVSIFENQDGAPVVEYSPLRDKDKWPHIFFGQVDGKHLLREACPIVRIGSSNQYRFIHRSVLEYGLARAVFEPQLGETNEQSRADPVTGVKHQTRQGCLLSCCNSRVEQQVSVAAELVTELTSPLCRRSFVNEPSIMRFLTERVQQEPIFERQLHSFIEQSKSDKRWNIAAANAITILVKAGILFNGADLKGIQIPGADLSGGQFDSAQLQGADLSNATLRNIWLRQANLSNVKMKGVEFGERPYLMEDSAVNFCAYSPDEKNCIFSLRNGTISVYDTSSWTKTHTLQGHEGSVNCASYSPSGQQIASGSDDHTVRLWNAQTGKPGPILRGHTDWVCTVVYSPRGRQIASGSRDNTVRLWDAQTGVPGPILGGHAGIVLTVVYSPSGHQIATGGYDKTLRLWDVQTGASCHTLNGHTNWAVSVVYSPSGQHIASGSYDNTVRLWDAQTGAPGSILTGHTNFVTSVVYSPSGRQIASGSLDNTVRLWDAQTGAPGRILSGHTMWVQSVVYSPSGQQIASGSYDDTVRLWDAQTGAPSSILSGHTNTIQSVVYSPSGHQIASGSHDNTVRLWDAQAGASGPLLSGHTNAVQSVAYSPCGHQIASGGRDSVIRLWDAQAGAPGPILSGHINTVLSVVYSPSGRQIASGGDDKTVRLWDAQTGASSFILSGHTSSVASIVYSPNGRQIASGSLDSTVRLWDAQTGKPGLILCGHTNWIQSVVYSPCGRQIASCGNDKTVRLWDAQTGVPVLILSGHTDIVLSVVYSPSGRQIASGSWDETVQLWDAETGVPSLILRGHTGTAESIAYSPCGRQIASGSRKNMVRLWDAQTGAPGPILSGHTGPITRVMYSPGAKLIVSCSDDRTVRLWDVNLGQCLAALTDFYGPITSMAWSETPNGTYFATGCGDKSVRVWRVVVEKDYYDVQLQWSSRYDRLVVSNISLQGARGLSKINMRLLQQRDQSTLQSFPAADFSPV